MMNHPHTPVLLEETLRLLSPRPGDVVVDCTVGLGGHASELAKAVTPSGHVIAVDLDQANLALVQKRITDMGVRCTPLNANFIEVPRRLREMSMCADVVLADLGFSSSQMDDPNRGFSFLRDGPLDMRYDLNAPVAAADLLASLSERELADLIYELGEEPLARQIARKLTQIRNIEPIRTTAQLAKLVREAYGARAHRSRMHPATRTFMALRIAVNDELNALRGLLEAIAADAESTARPGWLNTGARVAIISFHSLEDRLAKQAFARLARRGLATLLVKRPIRPSEREILDNPRARSAKLRAVRIGQPKSV